jgi:hypothetical protein
MVVYSCKKCGELNYLTPHAFWNISDFGAKCEKCETINTITWKTGNLKNRLKKWALIDERNYSNMIGINNLHPWL